MMASLEHVAYEAHTGLQDLQDHAEHEVSQMMVSLEHEEPEVS